MLVILRDTVSKNLAFQLMLAYYVLCVHIVKHYKMQFTLFLYRLIRQFY